MNDVTVLIFLACFVAVFGATFAFMWRMTGSTLSTFDKTSVNSYSDAMRSYKMPAPHPEMEGVKTGDELLIFTPEEYDEDDDDDDGGSPVPT